MGTPLNAVMLLWINLIMDTLGALAMSTEAPDPRVLLNPPRRKDEPVLSNNMIFYVLSEAAWQLLVQFYIMFHGYKLFGFTADNKKGINTLVFNINILMQLVNEFNGRHLQWTWDLCYGITGNKVQPHTHKAQTEKDPCLAAVPHAPPPPPPLSVCAVCRADHGAHPVHHRRRAVPAGAVRLPVRGLHPPGP